VPANVEREIRGWSAHARTLACERIEVVRCPDHETALRLVSAAGRAARLLSDTVVEIAEPRELAALMRKVRKDGLFLTAPPHAPARRRARRRYYD
jgi:hypothetical protein